MSRRPPHVVKTVDLASGKTVEIVYPADVTATSGTAPAEQVAERDLAVCQACSSELVEPVDWKRAGEEWRVSLWCPDCNRSSEGVFSQTVVDRLDASLEDATATIVADLKLLERANMLEHCDRFIAALNADAILPEDFR